MADFIALKGGWWDGTGVGYVWDAADPFPIPGASDNVTITSFDITHTEASECNNLTVGSAGTFSGQRGVGSGFICRGDCAFNSGSYMDGPIRLIGSLTIAASVSCGEAITFETAAGTSKTITLNAVSLNSPIVNNAGATSLAMADALSAFVKPSLGLPALNIKGGTFTLANATTNSLAGPVLIEAGTFVDGNAATVINITKGDGENCNLSIAAGATVTSAATWNLNDSATIANPTAGNALAVFNVADAKMGTLSANFNAVKLTGGTTAVIDLAGFALTVTTWEFDGILQASANGNLPATAALHPLAQLNIQPGVNATMTAATHATTVTGDATTTLTMAGNALTVTNMRLLGTLNASATGNLPSNTELYPLKELIVATGQTATMTGDLYTRRYAPAGTGVLDLAGFDLYIIGTTPVNEAIDYARLAGTGGGRVIFKAATRAIGVVEA